MSSYYFDTKNNQYSVQNVGFIIGAIKITCTGTVYLVTNGELSKDKIDSAVGFGFNCSEALTTMLNSVPQILSEYENTTDNIEDESFDAPEQELKYEKLV